MCNAWAFSMQILPLLTIDQLCDVLGVLRAKSGRAFMSPYASHIVQAILLALGGRSKAQRDTEASPHSVRACSHARASQCARVCVFRRARGRSTPSCSCAQS